ncbi:MAG: hypothetical protein HN348_24160, partial [Proteobacteria bacterium]|nr:hypothetical protein [Pseudomonadota bacterium]
MGRASTHNQVIASLSTWSIVALLGFTACQPPIAVTISPAQPRTVDELVATVVGAEEGATYAWFCDGSRIENLKSNSVPVVETAKGETWEVLVYAQGGGRSVNDRDAVTIVNTPPMISVTITPDFPGPQDNLVALP